MDKAEHDNQLRRLDKYNSCQAKINELKDVRRRVDVLSVYDLEICHIPLLYSYLGDEIVCALRTGIVALLDEQIDNLEQESTEI